jgi:Arc/MetJ-type ribon-helix-helix transcriptional regulator
VVLGGGAAPEPRRRGLELDLVRRCFRWTGEGRLHNERNRRPAYGSARDPVGAHEDAGWSVRFAVVDVPIPSVGSWCIPEWYHVAVSTQIAVRLPDELVAYVDEAVAAGRVKSRAELVARLIERDARRQRSEEDLQRLTARGALDDPELLDIVKSVADTPLPID